MLPPVPPPAVVPSMWVVVGVTEGEVVVRVVFGGEVAVVIGMED
jgi:hypothetical protein